MRRLPPVERFVFSHATSTSFDAQRDEDGNVDGGVDTPRQYPRVWQIDDMHVALVAVVLGKGEQRLSGYPPSAVDRDE